MEIAPVNASAVAPDLMNALRSAGSSPAAQTRAVATQFEAILLRQMLDKTVGSMMGDGPGSGEYGYLVTDLMAGQLAQGGGMGLRQILEAQLSPAGTAAAAASPHPTP
jgi:Rod binding domain-containing protein